mmetsp:Transcript_99495/g.297249  ORF Transcript_99495/g.297249 Transcript_99495/m.297249 type:complete len:384 (+) Transcript_99495:211-1362(+)|eukprot:CAMPEP_0175586324 /NCGR_PEP_ID=MMETSP0096-20121207/50178_1 /TAXON_ID=311494 /ORGANISM="Alexandrium monilatum, Strain CCMP3105" /LENGTH=383 /DNA_ID=CAMNT_0016890193 /DNA_START=151 /DNA_END=1302 /DNA_ORIENTATION=+
MENCGAEGIDSWVLLGVQAQLPQLGLARAPRVVLRFQGQDEATKVQLECGPLTATCNHGSCAQARQDLVEAILQHTEAGRARVDDAPATGRARINRHVSNADRLYLHLPEALLRPCDGKPTQRCRQTSKVMAAEGDLTAGRAHGQAKLGKQIVGAVHQALVEAAERPCSQPFECKAQDAVVRHRPERLVIQAHRSQDGKVCARLPVSQRRAEADVVPHQHSARSAASEVRLGKLDGHDSSVHPSACQPRPLLDRTTVAVDVHGGAGLPRRVAAVLQARRALAHAVWKQNVTRCRVKQHLQPLRRMANGDVAHVEAVLGVAVAWECPGVHTLQPYSERSRSRADNLRSCLALPAPQGGPEVSARLLERQERDDCKQESAHMECG